MFGERYTRWTSDNEDVEDDRHEEYQEDSLDERRDGYESMQEGRRILAMSTVGKPDAPLLTVPAMGRLMCSSILVFIICMTLSALAGYMVGKHKQSTMALDTTQPLLTNIPSTADKSGDDIAAGLYENVKDVEELAMDFQSHLTAHLIKEYIRNISKIQQPLMVKQYIRTTLESLGLTVEQRTFPVMMSLPNTSWANTVEIVMADNSSEIINNKTTSMDDYFPYSGFSPNGTAFGPLVYAHFGRLEDFELLKAKGVDPTDCIVLIRAGKLHPGIQVRNAEQFGAKGVILYPDLADFEERAIKGVFYPSIGSLPPDGVIWRNLRFIPGDPSTPFSPSQKDSHRISRENYTGVPSIVVQPISAEAGKILLTHLGGEETPKEWNGAMLEKYFLGKQFKNDTKGVRITSYNFIAEEFTTNMCAYLPSKDISKTIHIGCRYQSKGSVLTSSVLGLATLLALADAFSKAFPTGTQRQVAFNTFEAMDDDFSGGNEFAQLYSSWLESSALAYIDLDKILEGSGFMEGFVSPMLRETVRKALTHVAWPEGEALNAMEGLSKSISVESIPDNYEGGSNTLQDSFHFSYPFACDNSLNFASRHGIATVQLVSVNPNKSVSYTLQDSQYDTVDALITLEDKDLKWTHMMASILGVTSLLLSSTLLPPVRFGEVGSDISAGWGSFLNDEEKLNSSSHKSIQNLISGITREVDEFLLTSDHLDAWYKEAEAKRRKGSTVFERFRDVEDRLMKIIGISRAFLRPRNAQKQMEFGNVLDFGPNPDNPCEGIYFPYIKKALKDVINNNNSLDVLEEELSYVYSAIAAINTDILSL